jgi:diguanylate cyclase (GGDEF)-like protein
VFERLRAVPRALRKAWGSFSSLSLLAAVILLVGVVLSTLGALAWHSHVQSAENSSFDTTTHSVAASLATSVERDQDLLATVRTLLTIQPKTTNGELRAWLRGEGAVKRYPGAFGFTYIEHVRTPQLGQYIRTARRDPAIGQPATGPFVPFVIAPQGAIAPYCFTRLVYAQLPASLGGGGATGIISNLGQLLSPSFDYCDTPFASFLGNSAANGRAGVIRLSQLFGFTAKGGPRVPALVREALGTLPLFAIVAPVYRHSAQPTTPHDRDRALQGWVLGLFDATGLFAPATSVAHGVAVTLYHSGTGSPSVVLRGTTNVAHGARTTMLALEGDPGWSARVAVLASSAGLSATGQGIAVLIGGLIVSLLIFGIVEVLVVSRRKALRTVEQRTKDLRHQATHDSLTGLPNRDSVYEQAQAALGRLDKARVSLALFFIDLDDFKKVNDTFGHGIGDDLLRSVGARLVETAGGDGLVGRLGGDEFAVLAEGTSIARQPELFATRLQDAMREPFELPSGGGIYLSVSAGIGIAIGARESAEELLRDADTALFRAKSEGLGRYAVFEPEMHDAARKHLALDIDLRHALRFEQFYVVYQPIIDLRSRKIRGVEALLRWRHPERGVVLPAEFIAVLEESDLIIDVGRYVLQQACEQVLHWHEDGFDVGMSVNLSARQFHFDVVLDDVPLTLARTGVDPSWLTLEITESTAMAQTELMMRTLRSLRSFGMQIAIDDFGTGYSSLAYLRDFPIDILKIDRSFINAIEQPQGRPFLEALIRLGHSLDLEIVAEGIERPAQLEILVDEGCDSGQGFLFQRPVEASEITELFCRDGMRIGATTPDSENQPSGRAPVFD